MLTKLSIAEEIMEILKRKSKTDEYINPNFLTDINSKLFNYYQIEDEEVDKWIQDMWDR